MKELALKIGDTDFPIPTSVQHIINSGPFGENIISWGIQLLLVAAILFALFSFVLGGIQWITSAGNKEKLMSARNRVIFSIIGLFLVLLSFLIISTIGFFFGITFINLSP